MAYLRLIKTNTEEMCNTTYENIVVINHGEILFRDYQKVKIVKSKGQCFTFDIVRSNSVHAGDMSVSKFLRRTCHLHLDHTYWVEGCQWSTVPKSVSIDISKIGIIGHDEAIENIIWSVFEPRQFSAETRRKLNVNLPRGIVLYGPPGTGKTSMIRGICNHFNIDPRIVDGPELLKKYVGDSELAIRELFDEAICDQYNFGDESPLHVIVFDEMEALFPQRSPVSGGSNTHNTVVSQMLTMMDGYTQFNNVVVFGTTNRLDMIDSALLRSGRFDLKIKIDLPETRGRFEILKLHIDHLQKHGSLATDVTETVLATIAEATIGYNGADLVRIIQSASLLAMKRISVASTMDIDGKRCIDESKVQVNLNDIIAAHQTFDYERRVAQCQNISDGN